MRKSQSEWVKYPKPEIFIICRKGAVRLHQGENAFSLNYATSQETQTKENYCLHVDPGLSKTMGLVFHTLDADYCSFTLIWLYSALPDSLLTGLVSVLGLRTWRSGLEIGRPVTLIPSEKTPWHQTVSKKTQY